MVQGRTAGEQRRSHHRPVRWVRLLRRGAQIPTEHGSGKGRTVLYGTGQPISQHGSVTWPNFDPIGA